MHNVFIHPTADVSKKAIIGAGTRIWHNAHIREGAFIGQNCVISRSVYIDFDVVVGSNVKIQNNASLYNGTVLEDGVFIGTGVVFTNDKAPRAVNPDGTIKQACDWKVGKILVKMGASIGSGSIILPNIRIGKHAMIGAGSVVTKDVPAHALAYGNPARVQGYVCRCGNKMEDAPYICYECRAKAR